VVQEVGLYARARLPLSRPAAPAPIPVSVASPASEVGAGRSGIIEID
jgi:hypothetical protein